MKRSTHFLITLLLTFFVGAAAAWAGSQTIPTLSTDGNTHFYTIKNTRTGKYLYWNTDADFIRQSSTLTANCFFYFTAGSATTDVEGVTVLKIHNAATNNLMADFSSWTSSGIDWYVKAASNGSSTGIAFSKSTSYGDTQDSWNSYDSDNKVGPYKIDGGSLFEVEEVTTQKQAAVALKSLIDTYASIVGKPFYYTQTAYDALQAAYTQYNTEDALTTEVLTAIRTASNTFLSSEPFTEIANNTAVIFGNQLHSLYVFAKETNRNNVGGGHLGASDALDSYRFLFTLKKNSDGTFKIYSNYYGKYVGAVPTKNNLSFPLTDEANAGNFTISYSGTLGYCNIYDANCTYKSGNTTVNAWHMVNWNNSPVGNGVVRWETSAQASCFKLITDISTYTDDWDAAIIKKTENPSNGIGYIKVTDNLTTALTAFKNASADEKAAKYKALEEAIAATTTMLPETGKYYTIKCVRGPANGKYLSESYGDTKKENSETNEDTGNNALAHGTLAANIVPALWQFEQLTAEGKTDRYYIKGSNSKNYLSNTNGTQTWMRIVPESGTRGEFILNTSSSKVNVASAVALVDKSNSSADGYVSCRNEDNHVVAWDGGNDGSSNNFLIQEVSEIPVTISAAGYATLNLPMAVNIPEGVKAYTGTASESEIKLTEITSGIIPAQTPVILEGAGSETPYKFTIAYDNTDAALTTALKGTLTPTTIADDATAYVLKNGGQGIGLYKVTSTTDREIKANKAYYGSTTGSEAAPVLLFNFGQTTGIHSATTAASTAGNEANAYFDLQGRRVPCPAHGIFVKANGEKVFIK